MVRLFFGGSNPATVEQSEPELLKAIQSELKELFGIQTPPTQHVFFRWSDSFPQADVGHLDRLAALESRLPHGLYLAGSSYRGIGVPDCIRQGRDAGLRAIHGLEKTSQ